MPEHPLAYDPLTGALSNKIDRRKEKAGFVQQAKNSGGYIVINLDGRLYTAQDLIWCMMTESWPDLTVDHEDQGLGKGASALQPASG
ncbi:MAG TPA: hypothetical protein VGV17_10395 [Bosea sp. (in: a-proteobacteria)]|jgi:hypothetical protein|uniref:hypothetical protein n=1 Tax=Bosea sp. (in: a-proteobacteria) TaxID=1871050 RepID=UPI002DDD395B|nr:hypothetical protein [Bosea sp. (in: a-proteobacteria)]HEV2554158.1 hypothetical protein [Bosea sp. (in: a-proteobacteria)]